MTQFEDVLETILEEYARRDSKGEFDTWEETDAFVKEKAEVLLAYVKEEPVSENLEEAALEYANNQLIKSGVTDTNCPRELAVAQASLMVNGFKAGTKWQKQQMANDLPVWKKGGIAGGHWSGEAYVSQGRKPQLVYETMHIDVNELVKKLPKEDGI